MIRSRENKGLRPGPSVRCDVQRLRTWLFPFPWILRSKGTGLRLLCLPPHRNKACPKTSPARKANRQETERKAASKQCRSVSGCAQALAPPGVRSLCSLCPAYFSIAYIVYNLESSELSREVPILLRLRLSHILIRQLKSE